MAVYKVIQDVEAEDKILGPLSMKQMIFAIIAVGFAFLAFRLFTMTGSIFAVIPFLPFIVAFGALAAPLSKDQSSEMWLAARIRFLTKPHVRIWNQNGIKKLVDITAPKLDIKNYSDGLSQDQVHSRLRALSSTLDSRGWATKNATINVSTQTATTQTVNDRIFDPGNLPQKVEETVIQDSEDIMAVSNQERQQIDNLMQESTNSHKKDVIKKMQAAAQAASQPPTPPTTPSNQTTNQPDPDDDDDNNLQEQIEEGLRDKEPETVNATAVADSAKTPESSEDVDYSQVKQQTPKDSGDIATAVNATFTEDVVHPGEAPQTDTAQEQLTPDEAAMLQHVKEQKELDKLQSPNNHHKSIKTPDQLEEEANKRKDIQRAFQEQEDEKKAQEAKTRLSEPDTIELAKAKELKVSTIAGLAKHKVHKAKKAKKSEVVVNLH